MTDETKKLFDAPWTVYGEPDDYCDVIQNASEDEIATVFITDEAKRIVRLPELFDALQEAIFEINRLTEAWENGIKFPDYCESCLAENKKLPHQNTMEWAILLGKVKDGEQ